MKKMLATLAVGLLAAINGMGAAGAEPVKVGFVYLTNPGDHGWTYAHEVARHLGAEFTIFRNVEGADGQGVLSNKYGKVAGKKVVIIDDVLSSGVTMGRTIQAIRAVGGEVGLAVVLVNKTTRNEIEGVPLRGIIRAVPV